MIKRRRERREKRAEGKSNTERVCGREGRWTGPASREELVRRASVCPRKTLPRPLSWTADAPVDCPGLAERVSGPRSHSQLDSSWGCCAQEPLTLPRVSVSPAPDTVFSEAPGDTRQRAALRMQRKLRKCCMDTRRKVARSVSSRLAPDRSDARPRARWFPSWASASPSVQ